MRQVSEETSSHKLSDNQKDNPHHDIIQETRKTIKFFDKEQRFKKARRHLLDALNYKQARNDIDINENWIFQLSYHVQTSIIWKFFLFALSFLYMYLIIGEPTNRLDVDTTPVTSVIAIQAVALFFFWLDILMEVIHKSSWKVTFSKKFPTRFWVKLAMHILFIVDVAVYYSHLNRYPLRMFRILRPFLPYLYDEFARNILKSLTLAYKDILAYFVFYAIAIFSFGAIGSIIIRLPPDTQFDPMQSDYSNFFQMSFLMYVVSSYDTYPDYQMVALNVSIYYYIFWITFIFMNALFFVNIPNTFIFMSFKKFRSKQILIDEIRQQTSLVLSFICLGEDHLSIPSETFHQFMLYFYKNKLRLIDHIKELSFKLDQNNNQQIFISDFLKLCKLIQNDEFLTPPLLPDWEPYFKFRNFLIDKVKIKEIVDSYYYEFIVATFIIGNFILILCTFFTKVNPQIYTSLEIMFLIVFIVDVLLRIISEGIQQFFSSYFNCLDVILIIISVALLIAKLDSSAMLKTIRLVRIIRLFRIVRLLVKYDVFRKTVLQNTYGRKIKILFTQLYVAMAVGLRIFPIFCTIFYVFGIIGMEFLSFNQSGVTNEQSPYSAYATYSSFQNFIDSQLISIQIIIQSGWSFIVFDYAYRFNNRVGIFLFFILQHALIVQVVSATMKGLVGDLYDSVFEKIKEIQNHQDQMIKLAKFQKKMKDELFAIKHVLSMGIGFTQDTLKKKQIYENVVDKELMAKLKKHYESKIQAEFQSTKHLQRRSISKFALESSLQDFKGIKKPAPQPKQNQKEKSIQKQKDDNVIYEQNQENLSGAPLRRDFIQAPVPSMKMNESKKQNDLQFIYESLLGLININSQELPCPQTPLYPKFLVQFLNNKFFIADEMKPEHKKFDMNKQAINSPESVSFYINQLQGILSIKKPEDKRRKEIREAILKLKTTSNEELERLLNKEYQGSKSMSISSILRNVYMMGVNKDLIQKFEIQYFSDIYGETFKQMNRVGLEPLLKYESLMIHTFSKLLKYPGIQTQNFFNMLATIQENISKTLVKKGSIFKFVFQVAELAHNWFAIEVRKSKELRIHFLKTGIWTYLKSFKNQTVYYAQDIFHFNETEYPDYKPQGCQKTIRLLYNNFESLGFSLLNSHFFTSDPSDNVYDVYNMVFDCASKQQPRRFQQLQPINLNKPSNAQIKVSKIMLVILSKESQRVTKLNYKLSNLDDVIQQNSKQKVNLNFTFNEAEASTFAKLQNMAAEDHEKIAQSQGLPFAFIVDLMKSVRDVLKIHKETLITKVQEVFNKQFNKVEEKKEEDEDNIFNADWFPLKFL